MKNFLLTMLFIFSTNNVLASADLICNASGDWPYLQSLTTVGKPYQLLKMIANDDNFIELDGQGEEENGGYTFYMNRIFSTRGEAKNFCLAMKTECSQLPNSTGSFRAYIPAPDNQQYLLAVSFLNSSMTKVRSLRCDQLIPE